MSTTPSLRMTAYALSVIRDIIEQDPALILGKHGSYHDYARLVWACDEATSRLIDSHVKSRPGMAA